MEVSDFTVRLPQTRGMAFIEHIEMFSREKRSGKFSLTLRRDKAYCKSGYIDIVWLVEIMSQTAAALFNLEQETGEGPVKLGFLVGIDFLDIIGNPQLYSGDVLEVTTVIKEEFYPFGYYSFIAEKSGVAIAKASMKFVVDDKKEFRD